MNPTSKGLRFIEANRKPHQFSGEFSPDISWKQEFGMIPLTEQVSHSPHFFLSSWNITLQLLREASCCVGSGVRDM